MSYTSFAQQSSLIIDRFSVDQGLSQSDVKCLVQDSLGFLWVGTRDGLNRFDGHHFEIFEFDNNDSTALGFNQIHSINLLSDGNIIIGSVGGISIYDYRRQRFHNHFFDNTRYNTIVNDIAIANEIAILATTNGVIYFNTETKAYVHDADPQIANIHITQVESSPSHGEWIGTSTGLLMRASNGQPLKVILPGKHIYHINFDQEKVLVATNRGLFEFAPDGHPVRMIQLPPTLSVVKYTLRAADGALWVATDKVLVLSEDGSRIDYVLGHDQKNRRTLSEDRVRVLYQTRDGVLWLGTFGYGLNKHNPSTRKISTLTAQSQPNLSSNYVSAIYSANDTLVLVGTSRGLNIVNHRMKTVSVFNPQLKNRNDELFLIYAIKADKAGDLWMTATGGVYKCERGTFVQQRELGEIVDFADLDPASLLLVTRMGGCYKYDKRTREMSLFVGPSALSGDLTAIAILGDRIWLGAQDGLRSFDHNGALIEHFTADGADSTALPSNSVKGIFIDSHQSVWVGTWGGGFCRYYPDTKTFETFTTHDGLPSNVVYGLIEDRQGILWMSTNHGLSAYDPRRRTFRNFDVSDGLQSNEFNTGAYFQSANGVAYFGGVGGVSVFRPEAILADQHIADVFLSEVEDVDESLSNTPSQNVFEVRWHDHLVLHFAAIDFNAAHKYRFAYSLNGGSWRSLGKSRRLDLPKLAAGEYEIVVRASTNGRTWTQGNVLAKVNVRAPFWQRPLTYIILVGGLGMLAFVGYRFRVTTLKQMNARLNRIVSERTREVQLMNEEILSQNDKLLNRTEELTSKNQQLEQTRIALQAFQEELEKRVNQRTHDIQVLNQELLHQNAQLEQFSFITAHNFRGPVARIKGLIDLLDREADSSEEFARILNYLRVSISDLDNVIADVSALLHMKEKGKSAFNRVDVRAVMRKVFSELEPEIKVVGMVVDASGFEQHELLGIDAFFHSIFYNLMENALKYKRPDAVPALTISCLRRDENVVIEFSDNGIGIDLDLVMPKIFKIYQRFSFDGEGRGMGLYLVKTQTEMMGGVISVQSTVGLGTTFMLSFPVAR